MTRVPYAAGLVLCLAACQGKHEASPSPSQSSAKTAAAGAAVAPSTSASAAVASVSAASSAAPAPSAEPPPAGAYVADPKIYPWLADEREFPKPEASLETRFPVPPGYKRVKVEPGSFAEWLRGLPMAAEDTPVKSFDGRETLAAGDDFLAGVVAIDTGTPDLQQSSDVIVRLHAEYLWSKGEKDKISYRSATKLSMPLARWEKGQRLIASGANVYWVKGKAAADADHAEFRRYLDAVFNWANSTSLVSSSTPAAAESVLAGDFFLQSQAPNHVAVVLDIAEKPSGERVALLGQARNPAESIHVVRPGKATPWFSMRPPVPVSTPHSKALKWSDLRRMSVAAPPAETEK
ncbi:MAG TPA: DUF4846 domain-containing protein [Polyangiaceae bacterium]|nr:DUF4846 domain-containing protein [Polyangiaceae bacterium]